MPTFVSAPMTQPSLPSPYDYLSATPARVQSYQQRGTPRNTPAPLPDADEPYEYTAPLSLQLPPRRRRSASAAVTADESIQRGRALLPAGRTRGNADPGDLDALVAAMGDGAPRSRRRSRPPPFLSNGPSSSPMDDLTDSLQFDMDLNSRPPSRSGRNRSQYPSDPIQRRPTYLDYMGDDYASSALPSTSTSMQDPFYPSASSASIFGNSSDSQTYNYASSSGTQPIPIGRPTRQRRISGDYNNSGSLFGPPSAGPPMELGAGSFPDDLLYPVGMAPRRSSSRSRR